MFYRISSVVVVFLATLALVAALGGFGYLPEPSGFRWPSELGAPWAALGMAVISYGLAGWFWYMGSVATPVTPYGRYAKAAGTGYTIQIIGYMFILLLVFFGPQVGNWILGK